MPTLAGLGAGLLAHSDSNCSAFRYSLPVTFLQAPYSSPVTWVLRPTCVPLTRWLRLVEPTPTLAGAAGGVAAHNVSYCSVPMYSVPVIARQLPASIPVILLLRSTWVPVIRLPRRVLPSSTLTGAVADVLRTRPLGRHTGLSPRPFTHNSSRRAWAAARPLRPFITLVIILAPPLLRRAEPFLLLGLMAILPWLESAWRRLWHNWRTLEALDPNALGSASASAQMASSVCCSGVFLQPQVSVFSALPDAGLLLTGAV